MATIARTLVLCLAVTSPLASAIADTPPQPTQVGPWAPAPLCLLQCLDAYLDAVDRCSSSTPWLPAPEAAEALAACLEDAAGSLAACLEACAD